MATRKSTRRLSIQSLDIFSKRKRKRRVDDDDDTISIQSSVDCTGHFGDQDVYVSPFANKGKHRSILRASSLMNILSPKRANSSGKSSFKVPADCAAKKCPSPALYVRPLPSPAKQRATRTWSDSVASGDHVHSLPRQTVKRQEAIFELLQGEHDIAEDLDNVRKMYRDSMQTLGLCTPAEAALLFGPLDNMAPVHKDLAQRLEQLKQPDGTFSAVGQSIVDWAPQLSVYVEFCSQRLLSKTLLDRMRGSQENVRDFLVRCQESPFSRKLDLWGLLDGARGRFLKYPLLIKAIMKESADMPGDLQHLQEALTEVGLLIQQADQMTGKAECTFHKSRLVFVHEEQACGTTPGGVYRMLGDLGALPECNVKILMTPDHTACQSVPEIEASLELICQGLVKNNKGSKLQLYLFDKVVVLTRGSSRGQQVYRCPIPVSHLVVEDLADGAVRMGSFRNAFSQGQTSRNLFRLSSSRLPAAGAGHRHTLMAADEHDKQNWLRKLQSVTPVVIRPDHPADGV